MNITSDHRILHLLHLCFRLDKLFRVSDEFIVLSVQRRCVVQHPFRLNDILRVGHFVCFWEFSYKTLIRLT